jgi:hypothetical protein
VQDPDAVQVKVVPRLDATCFWRETKRAAVARA